MANKLCILANLPIESFKEELSQYTNGYLAKKYHVASNTVRSYRKKYGVAKVIRKTSISVLIDKPLKEVRALLEEHTDKGIARLFNTHITSVRRLRFQLGIAPKPKGHQLGVPGHIHTVLTVGEYHFVKASPKCSRCQHRRVFHRAAHARHEIKCQIPECTCRGFKA